jgi:3-isopropylmalate/(R)-2-methylmalate dehydratase small subunit
MNILPMDGRARLLGDDVNTDYIISSRRKKESIDPAALREHLLEDLDPAFAASVRPGDILVAGENFGCGSAMEVAVTVVLGAGIRAVVARSFSRTYLRNAMNNGLLPVIADTSGVREGDALTLALDAEGRLLLDNHRDAPVECAAIAPFMLEVLDLGGLVPYLRAHGGFEVRP